MKIPAAKDLADSVLKSIYNGLISFILAFIIACTLPWLKAIEMNLSALQISVLENTISLTYRNCRLFFIFARWFSLSYFTKLFLISVWANSIFDTFSKSSLYASSASQLHMGGQSQSYAAKTPPDFKILPASFNVDSGSIQ